MKSASLIAQPNFHRKKKKTSCSTFRFAQNDSKKKNIQVWKHHKVSSPKKSTTTPPHRTRVPQRSVAFRSSFRKKKKNMDLTATAATSGIAPEHLGHQPGPKGQQKTSKGWFSGTSLLDDLDFFNVERKKAGFCWDYFFFGWFFVVKDAFWKLYTCLRNLDPFGWFFFEKGWISQAGRPPWEVVVSW